MHRVIFLVVVTALMAAFTSGCATTRQKTLVEEPQYAEKIEMTVGADQSMVIDGKKVQAADIPKQLSKANASKYLIIVVAPESKLQRETLVNLLDLLKKDGYFFTMGEGSKFADVLLKAQSYPQLPVASRQAPASAGAPGSAGRHATPGRWRQCVRAWCRNSRR